MPRTMPRRYGSARFVPAGRLRPRPAHYQDHYLSQLEPQLAECELPDYPTSI